MLTLEQIYKSYPKDVAVLHGRAAVVEYLQYELLDSLYAHKESAHLSFIEGTAIRIVYNGTRFSEDLDFDLFSMSFEEFSTLLEAVILDMRYKGFEVEFRMVKKGAYHGYIRFPHILTAAGLSPNETEKVLVRVDAMPKAYRLAPSTFQLNRFGVYRAIRVNTPAVILAQKLLAIAERKRERGRDLFDVSYLYSNTEPDWEFIRAVTCLTPQAFYQKVLARVNTFDLEELARDAAPFVLRAHELERIRTFDTFITQKAQLV